MPGMEEVKGQGELFNKIDVPGEVTDEELKLEEEKKEEKVIEEEKKEEVIEDKGDDELLVLRTIAREQKRQLDFLTAKVGEQDKKLEEANIITPEDVEERKKVEAVYAARNEQLEDYLEMMRVSPAYEDVDEVCSQSHVDDLISALAKAYVRDNPGVSVDNAEKGISQEIWSMRNPYRFLHKTIKQHHPDYAKKVEDKKPEEKKAGKKFSAEEIAGSLQNSQGGKSGSSGGWTAAKIDSMDEADLGKVPRDVYMDYMRGTLK